MPYKLADFGSYTVGGRLNVVDDGEPRTIQFTRSASYEYDPRGDFAIEHAYVQYFVPEDRRPGPPVILVHGGGMSGACWETTPDGRPGWLHLLLMRGYEVHVIDNVERGRAGFAPGLWDGEPILRSLDEAWTLFRFGPADGFRRRAPFDGQLFPISHFDEFCRCFVPRWLGTSPLQVAALLALLERTGPALVICHSQGGEITFDAHGVAPDLFTGLIALEPSAVPDTPDQMATTPFVLCAGDYMHAARHWTERDQAWRDHVTRLAANGSPARMLDPQNGLSPGNSHMLMMDQNSAAVLDAALSALSDVTAGSDY